MASCRRGRKVIEAGNEPADRLFAGMVEAQGLSGAHRLPKMPPGPKVTGAGRKPEGPSVNGDGDGPHCVEGEKATIAYDSPRNFTFNLNHPTLSHRLRHSLLRLF